MSERVVVTGMGVVSPIGNSVKTSWQNLVNGISGVGPITLFNADEFLVQIACEVKDLQPERFLSNREIRRRDRFEIFASIAAQEAIVQSGVQLDQTGNDRIGVVVSAAIGGLESLENAILTVSKMGPRRVSPLAIPMLMPNGAAGIVAIDHGYTGPCLSIASACASGTDGIGIALMLLKSGRIDVAIAGGSEATITPVGIGAFDRLGAMSRRNEDYSTTPQPFDRNRDGLVIGEGAGILVLETENHARKRGATILAELAGYAATTDAYHVTAPREDGSGGARAIELALESAKLNLTEVDYINAHGTATPLNDAAETRAIKETFGDIAYNIPVSSTKSMTGHMMGATGAVEAVFCIAAIRENLIPPTIHYHTPDPECDLDYVPNVSREIPVNVVVCNSFGFGGHNAVLVFRGYN